MPSKSEYQQKLLDPRWQKKRLEILQRDGWKCIGCGSTEETLHVHHMRYVSGRDPWEYQADDLITLCEDCHRTEAEFLSQELEILTRALARQWYLSGDINELACILACLPKKLVLDVLNELARKNEYGVVECTRAAADPG